MSEFGWVEEGGRKTKGKRKGGEEHACDVEKSGLDLTLTQRGNDGRGAITQIERITAGYRWEKVQEHMRIVGPPTEQDFAAPEELGQTSAAGVDFGIF